MTLPCGELEPGDVFKQLDNAEDQSTDERQLSGEVQATHVRVEWREKPIRLKDKISIPRPTRRRALGGIISRIVPGTEFAIERGRLIWLDQKPPRNCRRGERWVDVPALPDIERICGKGRYFVANQDVKLWDSKTFHVLETYPAGSVFRLVAGTSECNGSSHLAKFRQVHWEKYKRVGKKKMVLDEEHLTLPLEQVGKPLIEEYDGRLRFKVIRDFCSHSAKESKPVSKQRSSTTVSETRASVLAQEQASSNTEMLHVLGDANGHCKNSCSSLSEEQAWTEQQEQEEEEEDTGSSRGICVACLESEALYVGHSCGHLVYCLRCFQDSVDMARKGESSQPKRANKSKSWKSTAIHCPVCRVKATLDERESFKGNVWVVEPFE
mmetsp:Transcript_44556/g.82927  ORF Transcript_44556/g.82927 Transcript_44556/m.82927 type:complete len:381 (+) Transcript_44556:1490-2632(+)